MLDFSRISLSLAALGSTACYTVDFDEQRDDVYYCQSSDECAETQACAQFRCVDDQGPQLEIFGPEVEPPTVLQLDELALDVSVDVQDFILVEDNSVQDGMGKLLLAIDPHQALPISQLVDAPSASLSLGAGLSAGPHRLVVQAVHGDGSPYTNPGAIDHTVFFTSDELARPQVALLEPAPGHIHVAGEPLEVRVINTGFTFVDNSNDCQASQGCDPFDDPDSLCTFAGTNCTALTLTGHTHIYMLPNYPECLTEMPGCNDSYIATVKPGDTGNANDARAVIAGDRFPTAGSFTLTATLQYSGHKPFPTESLVIFDQIPITIIER